MPKTQINGYQIKDQSLSEADLSPQSIEGTSIKDGSITNIKVADGIAASKIVISNLENKYVAANVETALNEAAAKIETGDATLNNRITTEVSTLNTTINANISELDNSITVINNNISTMNTTIATNKTTTDTEIANLKTADSTINGQITTMNNTIAANKTTAEDSITALQTTINNSVNTQLTALGNDKANLNGSLTTDFNAKILTVAGDILPSTNKLQNIGSTTNRFKAIYVDEAYLSTNTLYLGDTPVIGTSADSILIKADVDQSINIKTSGVGQTLLTSANGVEVSSSGLNADVKIQSTGAGGRVVMGAQNSVVVTAPYFNVTADVDLTGNTTVDSLTVQGNLTVLGTTTTVNSASVEVVDNIITVNKGEVGAGVTKGQAGLTVDRGTAADYMIVFDEVDDMFKVGMVGDLETIASHDWVTANMYVHPANHNPSIITQDTNNRFVTDAQISNWNGKLDKTGGTLTGNLTISGTPQLKIAPVYGTTLTNPVLDIYVTNTGIRQVETAAMTGYVSGMSDDITIGITANGFNNNSTLQILVGIPGGTTVTNARTAIINAVNNNGIANTFLVASAGAGTLIKFTKIVEEAEDATFNVSIIGHGINQPTSTTSWTTNTAPSVFNISNTGLATFTNTVTAPTFTGALTGNASTATTLQTARNINGVSFNGSQDITLPNATTSTAGLMSGVDKVKLNNTKQAITGQGTFAGNYNSTTITFGTAMANTNYVVSVTANAATDGKLGDVWVVKATTGFQVFNTGLYVGGFDYMVLY